MSLPEAKAWSQARTASKISSSEVAATVVAAAAETSSTWVMRARNAAVPNSSSYQTRITSVPVRWDGSIDPDRRAWTSRSRLRRHHAAHELFHLLRRSDAQLFAKQAPTEPVLAERLACVALGEVDADECSMCAFTQRL